MSDDDGNQTPMIYVESMVASKDEAPAVLLKWGGLAGQFTPAEARVHALRIIEAAEAAETDALLLRWLKLRMPTWDQRKKVQVLADFRALRG